MFCPKCGEKALDGADFCQKCGAKLIKDASAQSVAPNTAGSIQQTGKALAAEPKKKKPKKLFIILAIVFAFIVILIAANADDIVKKGEQAQKDEEYINSQQDSAGVKLSESYTNEEEGISFKYPSAWVPVSEDEFTSRFGKVEDAEYPLVFLANEIEDLPEENTYIMVSRFDATQDIIDHLFVDDEQFAATFDDDVTIEDTTTTKIDGVAARKITYLDKDGIGYQSYFYAVGSLLYRIDFSYKGENPGNNQRFFDAIIDSYTITHSAGDNESLCSDGGESNLNNDTVVSADEPVDKDTPVDDREMEGESYTDYREWGGSYDGGWMDTTLMLSLYSDGMQDPGCGSITTSFRGMEASGKLYYLGGNEFRWENEGYDSASPETYYVHAVNDGGVCQLELYNSDGSYEVTFTQYEQMIP